MADGMELHIDITIADYRGGGGNLRLSEAVTIGDADFMTMSGILAKFHEVLAVIKEAREATANG